METLKEIFLNLRMDLKFFLAKEVNDEENKKLKARDKILKFKYF